MNLKKTVILIIAFVGIALFFYFDLKHLLTLATLKASPRVLGSFVLLGLLALLPVLYGKFKNKGAGL